MRLRKITCGSVLVDITVVRQRTAFAELHATDLVAHAGRSDRINIVLPV
jgi:hypothetical protein